MFFRHPVAHQYLHCTVLPLNCSLALAAPKDGETRTARRAAEAAKAEQKACTPRSVAICRKALWQAHISNFVTRTIREFDPTR